MKGRRQVHSPMSLNLNPLSVQADLFSDLDYICQDVVWSYTRRFGCPKENAIALREMKMKTTLRFYLTLARMAFIKKKEIKMLAR
ncbi:hypothetical protein STEG23_006522, partial [Scotinomys teguina]